MTSLKLFGRLSLLALPALVACSGSDPSQTSDITQEHEGTTCHPFGACSDAGSNANDAATPFPTADAGSDASAPTEAFYSDGQILAILLAANAGEVAQGAQAQIKSADDRVKDFGHRMVEEHGAAVHDETELAVKLGVASIGSDVSHALEQDAAQTIARLAPLDCDAFDRAYADGQVTGHQKVLTLVDTKLIPSAQSASLRAHLAEVRAHVVQHLALASDLRAAIYAK